MSEGVLRRLSGEPMSEASRADAPPRISVIVETFNAGFDSDVTFEEAMRSLGGQTYPPEDVEFVVVSDRIDEATASMLRECLGRFVASTFLLEAEDAGYHTAKIMGLEHARGRVVAFADSDTILPRDWLEHIHRHLFEGEQVAVAGPTSFKAGSPLRTTLFLADFSLLSQDRLDSAPYFNANNVAFRRDVLMEALAESPDTFERFGGSSTITRALQSRGHRIALDREMRSVHGYDARTFYFEKRMRRYAHAAYVVQHDPRSRDQLRRAGTMRRPATWLKMWRRYVRHYQSRPRACMKTLGLGPARRAGQRVLLGCLSLWELSLIAYLAMAPNALDRLAQRYGWWEPEDGRGSSSGTGGPITQT